MAPRTCSTGDGGRYRLRLTQKQKREQSPVEAATVSSKVDFLRCMGLGLISPQVEADCCILCRRVDCVCEAGMMAPREEMMISMKPCSVLIIGERCKICKRPFKCESDLRDHMKKAHKRKVKVVLKFDNQMVSTKWIKKRHLKRPRRNSINILPSESSFNKAEGFKSSDSELLENENRPCSAPSLGTTFELPFCQVQHCPCCIKNFRPKDDNNNSDDLKGQLSFVQTEFSKVPTLTPPMARSLQTSKSYSILSQTSSWMEDSMMVLDLSKKSNKIEADVIVLDDDNDNNSDVMEVSPSDPPCYDLVEDESLHDHKHFHGDDDDDEVEKILEIRSNRTQPFIVPKIECDTDSQELRISDAIRDLMVAENSLSNHMDTIRESMEITDDDDDFILRYDDSEESCTFTVKDSVDDNKKLSKRYSENSFADTYSDMAIDHYEAFQKSSLTWKTTANIVERFSESIGTIVSTVDLPTATTIKEEVTIDHYIYV
uniref:C2H2-type domain-containing protein n=1 Tax=Bracon brevicornis TaxID=1563983 RepID=A0A6V7KL38_9HYME